jgi:hypothetical protein
MRKVSRKTIPLMIRSTLALAIENDRQFIATDARSVHKLARKWRARFHHNVIWWLNKNKCCFSLETGTDWKQRARWQLSSPVIFPQMDARLLSRSKRVAVYGIPSCNLRTSRTPAADSTLCAACAACWRIRRLTNLTLEFTHFAQ